MRSVMPLLRRWADVGGVRLLRSAIDTNGSMHLSLRRSYTTLVGMGLGGSGGRVKCREAASSSAVCEQSDKPSGAEAQCPAPRLRGKAAAGSKRRVKSRVIQPGRFEGASGLGKALDNLPRDFPEPLNQLATSQFGLQNEALDGDEALEDVFGQRGVTVPRPEPIVDENEAFKFLVNHLDAEIASIRRQRRELALQRQSTVNAEQMRLEYLFRCIDEPWLLLPASVGESRSLASEGSMDHWGPLPSTGLAVYVQEKWASTRNGGSPSAHGSVIEQWRQSVRDEIDREKLVKKWSKQWSAMPVTKSSVYVEAAKRNAELRSKMQALMTDGCADFETYCSSLAPWTADRVRAEKQASQTVPG